MKKCGGWLLTAFTVLMACALGPRPCLGSLGLTELRAYVRSHPNDLKAIYRLGKGYYKRGGYEKAIRLWQHIVRARPGCLTVYNRIGLAYYRLGELKKAEKVFLFVLKRDAGNHYARKASRRIQKKLGKDEPAPAFQDLGRATPPTDRRAGEEAYNQGMRLFLGKDFVAAARQFETSLRNQVRIPDSHFHLAESKLKEAEDPDGVIHHYGKVLEARSEDSRCYLGMGMAYGLKGDVEKQIECFEKCVRADPKNGDAHFHLALAYDKVNQSKKTFEHAQKAVKIDPKYKLKIQPLIKNSNVARKIGTVLSGVLKAPQLSDAQIEKYASKIAKILGEENLRVDLNTEEGKSKIRSFVSDQARMKQLRAAFKSQNPDKVRDILREGEIDVDIDGVMEKYGAKK